MEMGGTFQIHRRTYHIPGGVNGNVRYDLRYGYIRQGNWDVDVSIYRAQRSMY
jgi:hypothetical protein